MVFTHAAVGAVLTHSVNTKSKIKFSKNQLSTVYFVGIMAAILPDLDIVLLIFDKTIAHRTLISHSLALYLIISFVLLLIARVFKSKLMKRTALVFLLGVLSHLALDFFAGGIALLAPFSYELVGVPLNFPHGYELWAKAYITSKYMFYEMILFGIYAYLMGKNKNIIFQALPMFLVSVSIFTFILLIIFAP